MYYKFRLFLTLIFLMLPVLNSRAQDFAVKTNLLYDAPATANAGLEIGIAPKWTLDISGNLNAWSRDEYTKWKHWMIQPEARYWFCDRFSRHFVGTHLIGGAFNFAPIRDKRYQGYGFGGGIAYGFAFMLSRHLNLELEAGAGYMCLDYDVYGCGVCGRKEGEGVHHYVGPTKAAVNLVFVF